jgi:mitochondrial ATPase complex subunit ATP10
MSIFRNISTNSLRQRISALPLPHLVSNCSSDYRCHAYRSFSSDLQLELERHKDCAHRHTGIIVHPESIAGKILPGNVVLRTTRAGIQKLRVTELEFGNYWMLKDLKRTGEKPVLANESLIDEKTAKRFPEVKGARSLSGDLVDFPAHFLRKNRSRDPEAQCTLLAISFRDYGFRQLPSWIGPFTEALGMHDRVEVMKINVANDWFVRYFLRPVVTYLNKRYTDPKEHDSTFMYFRKTDELCDTLRMRNVMVGYVFLLDGIGRVRFAGSGEATDEEVSSLISLTKKLTPLIVPSSPQLTRSTRKLYPR